MVAKASTLHSTTEQLPFDTHAHLNQVVWWSRAWRGWISQLLEVEPPHAVPAHSLAQGASYDLTVSASREGAGTVVSGMEAGDVAELFGVAAALVEVAAAADEAAAAVPMDAQWSGAVALIGRCC